VDTVDIVLIVAALLVVDLIVWAVIIRNRLCGNATSAARRGHRSTCS